MKIVHVADTHLGLSAFNRVDPKTGMNLREQLIYDNFLAAIDRIIDLHPDALVHAGDLFHQVKPKTRAYTTALDALGRLRDAGIPVLMVAGNHSMAKTRYTASPFEVLERAGYRANDLYIAHHNRYRRVELDDVVFHLIPNMLLPEGYRAAFEEIEFSSGTDVLVTHGLASVLSDRRLRTVAEHELDATILSDRFDYIALGHFHDQVQVTDNAWYSGSLEYCNYGEISDTKGGLVVDLASGEVRHVDLPHTPMINLGRINCDGLSAREVVDGILDAVDRAGKGIYQAICQITLDGIRRETLRALDQKPLAEVRSRVLDLKLQALTIDDPSRILYEDSLVGLDYVAEFKHFVEMEHLAPGDEEFVKKTGTDVLRTVIARHKEGENAAE
ncbi:metallophosphoesterase family protein [Methanoculleus thermophilus]|jgi:exonuclease SbcD|uniref:DNA repair exonuclease SbcCD nuclease subunit n=1 Tax=Methanoculleus thermophilus TaxID=2200 RepID=A0A1G9BN96_9EURY|nr:exonuclease SbcCD subunit D [Methanoculleus thermophilus]SDK40325.1 DNA repair exonuclease SbcCD nuclease subunit [Methanoculleus thermophilus]